MMTGAQARNEKPRINLPLVTLASSVPETRSATSPNKPITHRLPCDGTTKSPSGRIIEFERKSRHRMVTFSFLKTQCADTATIWNVASHENVRTGSHKFKET